MFVFCGRRSAPTGWRPTLTLRGNQGAGLKSCATQAIPDPISCLGIACPAIGFREKCGLGRLISKLGEEFCLVLFVVAEGGGRREGG